jgi:hypothetical protein
MFNVKRMRFVYLFAAFVLIIGCGGNSGGPSGGGANDDVGMKNLPSSISISIPKTLGTLSTQSSSVLANNQSLVFATETVPAPQSLSYGNVNNIVAALKSQMASMSSTLVFMDRVIDGLTPSDTLISGKKITVTQAMVDTILSLIPEEQRAAYKEVYTKEGIVGKEEAIDSFYYQSVSENGYNYKYSSTSDSGSMTVYWSTDKKLIKIVMKSSMYTYGINTNLSEKSSRMYIICNLSADNSPTGKITKTTSIIGMKEISGSSKNAVYVTSSYLDESETGIVKSFNFEGVADNDGGYITNNYLYMSYVIPQQNIYCEGFNSTGALTYQKNGAMVVYGEEPAVFKAMFDSGKTAIDSLQGSINNDTEITGSSSSLFAKAASWALKGECYVIYNSNSADVVDAITGLNDGSSSSTICCATLNPHIIGLAVCDKNGSLSIFINNQTLYSSASELYFSKYSFTDMKMSNLINLAK